MQKTERNLNVVKFALRNEKLRDAAKEFDVSPQMIEKIVKLVVRKKIPDERAQYLTAKTALEEYHDRLIEILN
jgi:transposase